MSSSSSHDQQQPRQGHGEQAPALNKPRLAKKQTRRRLHRSRPYQERLLNMAEARREIATALRIHRANMRHQRSEFQPAEQRQQPRLQFQQPVQVMIQQQSQAFVGVPVAMCYANSLPNGASDAGNYSSSMLSYDPAPLEEAAPVAIGGQLEHLACGLPAQPLGLNLSFHGFGGSLDTTKNSDDSLGVPSPCRPPSVHMSPVTTATAVHGGYSSVNTPAALSQALDGDGKALHSVRGGEMQGCVELSETAANATAATSAWTSKTLESMESGGESARAPPQMTSGAEAGAPADDTVVEAVGWPEWQWLCDGVGVEQQVTTAEPDVDFREMHIDDGDNNGCCFEVSHGDSGGDVALPCIDVLGEIEGWDDGDWFP